MMLKALITGFYINPNSTTYDLILSDEGFTTGSTIDNINIKFGFKNSATVLSSFTEEWQEFPETIGRFELLYIEKTSDGVITQDRLEIDACSSGSNEFCISDTRDFELYGDPDQSKFGLLALQVRPCQT